MSSSATVGNRRSRLMSLKQARLAIRPRREQFRVAQPSEIATDLEKSLLQHVVCRRPANHARDVCAQAGLNAGEEELKRFSISGPRLQNHSSFGAGSHALLPSQEKSPVCSKVFESNVRRF